MRRTSPRRFAPLATLCAATVASLVLAAVTKLGDTEQSFSEIVGVGERGEELGGVRPWRMPATEDKDAEWVYVLQLEGDGFAAARRRWGLRTDTNYPYIDKRQREVLENLGLVRWVVKDSRTTSRTVRTAPDGAAVKDKLFGLVPRGVALLAKGYVQLLVEEADRRTEVKKVCTLTEDGIASHSALLKTSCAGLAAAAARRCERELKATLSAYVDNVPEQATVGAPRYSSASSDAPDSPLQLEGEEEEPSSHQECTRADCVALYEADYRAAPGDKGLAWRQEMSKATRTLVTTAADLASSPFRGEYGLRTFVQNLLWYLPKRADEPYDTCKNEDSASSASSDSDTCLARGDRGSSWRWWILEEAAKTSAPADSAGRRYHQDMYSALLNLAETLSGSTGMEAATYYLSTVYRPASRSVFLDTIFPWRCSPLDFLGDVDLRELACAWQVGVWALAHHFEQPHRQLVSLLGRSNSLRALRSHKTVTHVH